MTFKTAAISMAIAIATITAAPVSAADSKYDRHYDGGGYCYQGDYGDGDYECDGDRCHRRYRK